MRLDWALLIYQSNLNSANAKYLFKKLEGLQLKLANFKKSTNSREKQWLRISKSEKEKRGWLKSNSFDSLNTKKL